MQGDPADAVFFIEDGDCQVGYNQRRTADEDLISTVSTLLIVRLPHGTACAHQLMLSGRCSAELCGQSRQCVCLSEADARLDCML